MRPKQKTVTDVASKKKSEGTLNRVIKKNKKESDVSIKKKEKSILSKTLKNQKNKVDSILKIQKENLPILISKRKAKKTEDVISKKIEKSSNLKVKENKKNAKNTVLKVKENVKDIQKKRKNTTDLAVKSDEVIKKKLVAKKNKKNAAVQNLKTEEKVKNPKTKKTKNVATEQVKEVSDKSLTTSKRKKKNIEEAVIKTEQSKIKKKKITAEQATQEKSLSKTVKGKQKAKSKEEDTTDQSLKKKDVMNYVKALLNVIETDEQKKKTLFGSDKPPIFLLVNCVKVPKVPLHQMRMSLPNSMLSSTDDVALFVKDIKRGRRRDFEDTVHHYEDLLQQKGCTNIKTIIPINQVKTEYRQFEMRRRLMNSYDYFLTDGSIAGHLAHLLGKEFREKRKMPTSIHMNKDLKKEIDAALKKTSIQIHSNGNSYLTQIATCSMSVQKITDNIMAVVEQLSKNFPGGWENIRSLRIKTPLSIAIPIYITLKNRNEVTVPVIAPKRPKAYKTVEGELSTIMSDVRVAVTPDGTIDILKLSNQNAEDVEKEIDEDLEQNEEDNEEDKENENDEEDEADDDDEDDDEDEDEN